MYTTPTMPRAPSGTNRCWIVASRPLAARSPILIGTARLTCERQSVLLGLSYTVTQHSRNQITRDTTLPLSEQRREAVLDGGSNFISAIRFIDALGKIFDRRQIAIRDLADMIVGLRRWR